MKIRINFILTIKICFVVLLGWIITDIIYTSAISHKSDTNVWRQYMYLFNDTIKKDIDTVTISYVKDKDICNNFTYIPNSAGKNISDVIYHPDNYSIYNITIWEFKDFSNINLNDISIRRNVNMEDLELKSGEILFAKSRSPISITQRYSFESFGINLNTRSTISRKIIGSHYKGFYGTISKMSFINEKGIAQIFFNYYPEQPTVLLLYKLHQRFFVIIINCNKPFDESIIKIFNLD